MFLLESSVHSLWVFLLVLTRLGAFTFTAPAPLGSRAPLSIRAVLAILLALLVAPVCLHSSAPIPRHLVELVAMLIREALLGLFVGWSLIILFSAIQIAGRLISQVSGMQLAEIVDTSADGGTPVIARLLELVALAVFFSVNGHHQVLEAMLSSFRSVPPGAASWLETFPGAILEATCQSFEVGLRAAAPVTVAILLAVLLVALLGRTLPQLNILAVGFGLNSLVLLGVLCLSAGSMAWLFQQHAESFLTELRHILVDR
jgi:flagellar biosynthesis protein FliR